jgi:hypothetical protein
LRAPKVTLFPRRAKAPSESFLPRLISDSI